MAENTQTSERRLSSHLSYLLEEFKASQERPDVAPPQQLPPDDGQVVQRPNVVLGGFDQVGGGFGRCIIIHGGQHPHAQARYKPRLLSIKQQTTLCISPLRLL